MRSALIDVLPPPCAPGSRRIICAFCFMTSAGVSTRQDDSSATPDAAAWTSGSGDRGREDAPEYRL